MRATEQAFTGSNVFRHLRNPAKPGDLRRKAWRYLIAPASADDPVWAQRVADYWTLQGETYGLLFDERVDMIIDFDQGLVLSQARVVRVLPGRRELGYVAPRKRAA